MDSKRGRWSAIGVAGWVWALATVSVLAGAAAFPGPGGTAAVRDPQRSPAVDDTLDAIGETLAGEGLAIDEREMDAAIRDYGSRQRRFGYTGEQVEMLSVNQGSR